MALLLAALPSSAGAASQPFTISDFDTVRMEAPFRVIVTTGSGVSARGEGDRDLLDRVDMSVSNRRLTIRLLPLRFGQDEGRAGNLTLRLFTQTIRRIFLAGSGSLTVDKLTGLSADTALTGSGELSVGAVRVDNLAVTLAGNGRLSLTGTAERATVRLTGGGALDAPSLSVKTLSLTNEGPGTATLTATKEAKVIGAGAGDVTVLGKPACTVNQIGAGQVRCGS